MVVTMNNKIILKGIIKDITYSHTVNNIIFDKANLIVKKFNGQEDLITLKFKKFTNPYKDGQEISLIGQLRSYSKKLVNKNEVEIYVFTYFDKPETDELNNFVIEGKICKIGSLKTLKSEKEVLHFILANNIEQNNKKLNNYLPIICWGQLAKKYQNLKVNDTVIVKGELHSKYYKKIIDNDNLEIKLAHELVADIIEVLNEI